MLPALSVGVLHLHQHRCAPIDPSGRTRRELAGLARAAIAAALGRVDDARRLTRVRRAA